MPVISTSRTSTKLESRSHTQPPTPSATSDDQREAVAQRAAVDHRHHCRRCFDPRRDDVPAYSRCSARPTLSTSPAPIVSSRSPSRSSVRRNGLGGRVVAHPGDALAVAGVGRRLGDEQAGDAGVVLGGLARGIDVEDHRQVGLRQRLAERRRLALGPAVQVRLEERDDAARVLGAGGGDRRRDLGRVVRVVVDDARAGGGGAERARSGGPRPGSPRAPRPRSSTSAPASLTAVSAAAALRALWAPGTVSVTGTPSNAKRRAARASAPARRRTRSGRPPARSAPAARPRAAPAPRKARNVSSTSRRDA